MNQCSKHQMKFVFPVMSEKTRSSVFGMNKVSLLNMTVLRARLRLHETDAIISIPAKAKHFSLTCPFFPPWNTNTVAD